MSKTVTHLLRFQEWIVDASSALAKSGIRNVMLKRCDIFLFLVVFFFFLTSLQAQSTDRIEKAIRLLDENPEVYLSIPADKFNSELASRASLDYFTRSRAFLYVNKDAMSYIISQKISFRLEQSPGSVNFELNMLSVDELLHTDLTESWDFYPTYDAYVALMYKFENDYPDLVKIHQIGTTVQGRALLFAQIKPAHVKNAVPQFMYTSTIHGDETTGFILSLRLIHHLISNYGSDEDITDLMGQVEIWICPNENPDGTYTNDNETVSGATRSNANGKDLNRNYPAIHPLYPVPPETPVQPETQAMMNFVADKNFIMSANMHGGIELVNYPFDAWESAEKLHADNDWWKLVSNEYADTVHAHSKVGYFTGLGTGVTHGGDWYVIYGSRQDYMNYIHSCREFTLELSNQKLLNPIQLPAHWEYNHRSLINYIRQATYGIHGLVKDSSTDLPVFATLELTGHDADYSQVITAANDGYFSRPVSAGKYDLTFTADGYSPATMAGISIDNYDRINLTVFLGDETYPLYVYTLDDSQGTVTGSGIYPAGSEITVQATPTVGYSFDHWQDDKGVILDEDSELTFLMPDESRKLYAVFEKGPTEFAVYYSTGTGEGSVEAKIDEALIINGSIVPTGSDVHFIATPEPGYEVSSWVVNGTIVPDYSGDEYILKEINSTTHLEVNFAPAQFLLTVTLSIENSGDIVFHPEGNTFEFGQLVSLTAAPKPSYVFDFWTDGEGNFLSYQETYSFVMPNNDVEIIAVFSLLAAISDVGVISHIRVFPNPAQNQLTIETDFKMQSVEIIDENGRLIMSTSFASNNSAHISLSGISKGFYLLKVDGEFGPVVRKLQVL
jgi:hypothetical protein